jgi:arginase
MKITLLQVPYHYGFVGPYSGAGRGPVRYLEAGIARSLEEKGLQVTVQTIERHTASDNVVDAVAEGNSLLATQVAGAMADESFPVVLSGGCNACLGVLAGLRSPVGIIWFDAHGDMNTPETTPSGFFDGMPLAVATGLCHHELRQRISSTPAVPPAHTLLAGIRELDPGERTNIEESGMLLLRWEEMRGRGIAGALEPHLEVLRSRVGEIYLHIDIDVLDPAHAPGVDYHTPGGLNPDELEESIRLIASRFRLRAAALTAYNPDHEQQDRTLHSGLHLLKLLAELRS